MDGPGRTGSIPPSLGQVLHNGLPGAVASRCVA